MAGQALMTHARHNGGPPGRDRS